MKNNYQQQRLAEQISQIIKKYETVPQFSINTGRTRAMTPAVITPVVGILYMNQADDGFHLNLKTEKALIHSARESNSIQEQDNIVMPNINSLLVQREKILSLD